MASTSAPSTSESSPSSSLSPAVLSELQSQLHDTQSSLATHVDKVRALEGVFKERDAIKCEGSVLRKLVEHSKASSSSHPSHEDIEGESDDDDDARSIATVTPHELERVEEEDEEQLHLAEAEENNDDRSCRRAELGRPRTPEPSSLGIIEDDEEPRRNRERSTSPPALTNAGIDERRRRAHNEITRCVEGNNVVVSKGMTTMIGAGRWQVTQVPNAWTQFFGYYRGRQSSILMCVNTYSMT